jgi:hypothetical protein
MRESVKKLAIAGVLTGMAMTHQAHALPLYTKQTGMDCTGCHAQHIPTLNSFGRKFMASGMTLSQKNFDSNATFLEGTDVNFAVFAKAIYAKTWDKPGKSGEIGEFDTTDGEFYIPQTATLSVGGRITQNIGALVNLAYKENDDEDNALGGKIVYARETEGGYWGVTAYSMAYFGPFSGMEFYNTGLYKPLRSFDNRKLTNAFQATDVGSGDASGMQVYVDQDSVFSDRGHFFATVGFYGQGLVFDENYADLTNDLLPFARIAYEHPIGDFNLIVGAFGIKGGSIVSATEETSIKRETYGMDMQIEGVIADKPVELTLSKVFKNTVTYSGEYAGIEHLSESLDNEAFSVSGEVNLLPQLGLKLAYMDFDDKYTYADVGPGHSHEDDHEAEETNKFVDVRDLDYAITLGADYSFKWMVDMKLSMEYTWASPALDRVENYRIFMAGLSIMF